MTESVTDPQFFTKAVTELGELRPVVTTRAIFNSSGVKIVEKGVSVNPGLYERLMQHQLETPIEDSVTSAHNVTGRMLRDNTEELMRTVPFFARLAQDDEIRSLLLDTIERVPLPDPIAFQLTLAHEVRPALYQHSLCSALVAAWLAIEPKISRVNMRVAAAAGLLHDIGILHLDPRLLEYKSDINHSQRRQLYSHPLVSTVLIERHPEYPREVVRAVTEHHEFLDGSGYPRNLVGDEISHMARIVSLTELIIGVFAPGRQASEMRLSMLLRMNMHRYDAALAEKVMPMLQPQHDLGDTAVTLMEDPVSGLLAIDGVLVAWPASLAERPDLSKQRRENFSLLTKQVSQLHRTLARVGVAPAQLAQLGNESLGVQLQTELTLLAGEAAWQLRTLAREAGRRWRAEPGTSFPAELQEWLDRAVGVVFQISGVQLAEGDGDE
jgi:putative nucleotidyltransferase with HDIG domain